MAFFCDPVLMNENVHCARRLKRPQKPPFSARPDLNLDTPSANLFKASSVSG
jgi:hypothetical protein